LKLLTVGLGARWRAARKGQESIYFLKRSAIYSEGILLEISRKPCCQYLIGWKTTNSVFGGKKEGVV